jgi:hypothetical protein
MKEYIQFFNIRIAVLVILMFVSLLIGCNNKNHFKAIIIKSDWHFFILNNSKDSITGMPHFLDSTLIIYYKGYVLYKFPPVRIFETDKPVADSEPFFLCNSKDSFGYRFVSINDATQGIKYKKDSFLVNNNTSLVREIIATNWMDSIIKVQSELTGDILTEKYITGKSTAGENDVDTFICCYSKQMNDVTEYSFSRKLDSLKKMKLFKAAWIFNEKIPTGYIIEIPRREYLWEFYETDTIEDKRIMPFFEKFIKWYEGK